MIPDWIERGYEIVVAYEDRHEGALTREQAEALLVDHAGFPDDPADAAYALDRLLNHGLLYDVHGDIRVTDPDT